jgi:hypothetical protein
MRRCFTLVFARVFHPSTHHIVENTSIFLCQFIAFLFHLESVLTQDATPFGWSAVFLRDARMYLLSVIANYFSILTAFGRVIQIGICGFRFRHVSVVIAVLVPIVSFVYYQLPRYFTWQVTCRSQKSISLRRLRSDVW